MRAPRRSRCTRCSKSSCCSRRGRGPVTSTRSESRLAEALSYFPNPDDYNLGPEEYLEQIRRIKAMVDVPVIGSRNCGTGTGWVEYAQLIQHAGADALELNIYYLATDPTESGAIIDDGWSASRAWSSRPCRFRSR